MGYRFNSWRGASYHFFSRPPGRLINILFPRKRKSFQQAGRLPVGFQYCYTVRVSLSFNAKRKRRKETHSQPARPAVHAPLWLIFSFMDFLYLNTCCWLNWSRVYWCMNRCSAWSRLLRRKHSRIPRVCSLIFCPLPVLFSKNILYILNQIPQLKTL